MPITINNGGVLKTLTKITANNNGTLYPLKKIYTNNGGVLREIFTEGWKLNWSSTNSSWFSMLSTDENGLNFKFRSYIGTGVNYIKDKIGMVCQLTVTSSITLSYYIYGSTNWGDCMIYIWENNSSSYYIGNENDTVTLSPDIYYIYAKGACDDDSYPADFTVNITIS